MALPFAPGAAREILRANEDYLALVPDPSWTTTSYLPKPLTHPCVTIRAAANPRQNTKMSRVLCHLNVWVPKPELLVELEPAIEIDPEELAWNIAALAAETLNGAAVMGRRPAFRYEGAVWRGEWVSGPTTMADVSRGHDNPLERALVEINMKVTS